MKLIMGSRVAYRMLQIAVYPDLVRLVGFACIWESNFSLVVICVPFFVLLFQVHRQVLMHAIFPKVYTQNDAVWCVIHTGCIVMGNIIPSVLIPELLT